MESGVEQLKSWLKDNPKLYDLLQLSRRVLRPPPPHSLYGFLNDFSRSFTTAPLRFIQIGANDGLRNDPLREFVVRDGWQGVLVEPLPPTFSLLKKNYTGKRFAGLRFVNAAVSSDSEKLLFWTVREDFLKSLSHEQRLSYLRKASFDREHVLKFLLRDGHSEDVLEKVEVACVTVEALAKQHFTNGEFDLLAIDAEGHEKSILSSLDLDTTRPRVILYESQHLAEYKLHIARRLTQAGYRVRDIGDDTVAVRS